MSNLWRSVCHDILAEQKTAQAAKSDITSDSHGQTQQDTNTKDSKSSAAGGLHGMPKYSYPAWLYEQDKTDQKGHQQSESAASSSEESDADFLSNSDFLK